MNPAPRPHLTAEQRQRLARAMRTLADLTAKASERFAAIADTLAPAEPAAPDTEPLPEIDA